MAKPRVFSMTFAKVYPLYVQKAERKGRTKEEVDEIISWLTGYDDAGLERLVEQRPISKPFLWRRPPFIRIAR